MQICRKVFENYKQKYLNYKEAFDYILNPKNEEYLIEYLGKNETMFQKMLTRRISILNIIIGKSAED